MPETNPLVKIIVPLAIGCASLSWYNKNYTTVDNAVSSAYKIAKIEMNTINKSSFPGKIKNITSMLVQNLGKLISPHEKNKYAAPSNNSELVDYAGRLGVSPNAMSLDDVVNTLDNEYNTLWPEHPVDEKYFLATMSLESGFNPKAYNPNGGATGLSGFLPSSWRKNSDKSFKYATDPDENIKALIRLTQKNLAYLQENYSTRDNPNWDNLSELEQDIQLGLAHSAGPEKMKRARFNPYNLKRDWIRTQSINYQTNMRDYLTR